MEAYFQTKWRVRYFYLNANLHPCAAHVITGHLHGGHMGISCTKILQLMVSGYYLSAQAGLEPQT